MRDENGAGNGGRTRDLKLGKLALYQLSYARPRWRTEYTAAPKAESIRGLDGAAPEDFVIPVEDRGLSRGDGALRITEPDRDAAAEIRP